MIQKVLIANRGEIAVRVMRSCKEMGIRTVAVFSEADRTARHVMYADEACLIGPAASKESYLNIDNIIKAARQHHADAIHPGYGFLSENADFARRCKEEGIIFIGPSAETMEAMGDKIAARKRMIAAGVPVVPGTEQPLQSAEEAVRICNEIGYPVMLKASMGGGGKGMRLIHSEDEVVEAYNTARSESMSSFGDDTVYLEKFVEEPHHIEFQILGDNHGNVIHLFDRECSVQRRNQKIVEESPSPFLTPELRQEMGEKAVAAARAVNYSGAGTIEFLVDKNRNFYFLEMNTRLQVEHPITEEVVGVDLVKEQIRIANDEVLHLKQEELYQRGHAIEFARNVLGYADANSREMDEKTPHNVIDIMEEQKAITNMGGTMRLGAYECVLDQNSKTFEAYKSEHIQERHRHRYEFNNDYKQEFEKAGMKCVGINPESDLVEIVEIPTLKWFIGVQFHPEYSSTVLKPHPLFLSFIKAAINKG